MKKIILTGLFLAAASAAPAEEFETGPNISGESGAMDNRRALIKQDDVIRRDDNLRIEVPRQPDGRPFRPVRELSRTEKMEMDDLEYRYQQGLIGDAEYYARRNAIMERIGMGAEY